MTFGMIEFEVNVVYDKIKAALFVELQHSHWILLRERRRVVVELVDGDAKEDVDEKGYDDLPHDPLLIKDEPDPLMHSPFHVNRHETHEDGCLVDGADDGLNGIRGNCGLEPTSMQGSTDNGAVKHMFDSTKTCEVVAESASSPKLQKKKRGRKSKLKHSKVDSKVNSRKLVESSSEVTSAASDVNNSESEAGAASASATPSRRKRPRRPLPKEFPCKSCEKVFIDQLSLARHTRWRHSHLTKEIDDDEEEEVVEADSSECLVPSVDEVPDHSSASSTTNHPVVTTVVSEDTNQCSTTSKKRSKVELPCFLCASKFRLKSRLRKHLEEAHLEDPLECRACSRKCDNFVELTKHLKRDHRIQSVCFCDWCGQYFLDEDEIVEHAKESHREMFDPITCPLCSREMLYESKMEKHLSSFHNFDVFRENDEVADSLPILLDNKFECQICREIFFQIADASGHDHSDDDKKNLSRKVCTYCGKSVTNLYEHVARVHSKEQAYDCVECAKTFPSKAKLNEHFKTVHTGELKAICDVCGKQFSNVHKARRHMVAIHTKEKCFCDVCGKECPHREALYSHMIRNHSGKVYHCHICAQKFSLPENMKRHVQTVHMKSKISCPDCGKEFTCKDHLRRHCKSVHEGKRHQCNHCEKNYSQAGDLHRHMKVAHGTLGSNELKMAQAKAVQTAKEDNGDEGETTVDLIGGEFVECETTANDASTAAAAVATSAVAAANASSLDPMQFDVEGERERTIRTAEFTSKDSLRDNQPYQNHSTSSDSLGQNFADISLSFLELNGQSTSSVATRFHDQGFELNQQLLSQQLLSQHPPQLQRHVASDETKLLHPSLNPALSAGFPSSHSRHLIASSVAPSFPLPSLTPSAAHLSSH